jgi:hypothetical protein
MSGLKVWTIGGGDFEIECVDAGVMKSAIEAGEHKNEWLPTTKGGSVFGGAIVAIGPPPPSPTAEALKKSEYRRRVKEEDERRVREGLPPLDDPPSSDVFEDM